MQYTNLCWEPRTSMISSQSSCTDKGWYSITDIVGEEKNIIYKSRNAQEAYLKWNIYIGRKKERLTPEERKRQREERYEKKREQNREHHRI